MNTSIPDIQSFSPYFYGRRATASNDVDLMQDIYSLRFNVYCLECNFLRAEDYPDGRERDEYDPDSAHFCAFNLRDELVGYVRLVEPDSNVRFPFQDHCASLFDGLSVPPPQESAEISRLMVRQDYRRRKGDTLAGASTKIDDTRSHPERRDDSPQILLCLYRQMYLFSRSHGKRYWYAAMERSLSRVLTRMNFSFRQVGAQTNYYGPVAPYLADLRELETSVATSNPRLLRWMQEQSAGNR